MMAELLKAIAVMILVPALSWGAAPDAQEKVPPKQEQEKQPASDQVNGAKTEFDFPLSKDPTLIQIDEFQLRRSALDAGFRRMRSQPFAEIVNPFSIRKRGRFYGSVYEYHRNDYFDARNFFDPVGEKLPEYKRNQFGGSFGSLISSELQVFGTYDGLRINQGETMLSLIPTAAMRDGDFSALAETIVDPFTGEPFANNQIPAGRIHPVAARLLQAIPLPNRHDEERNFVNNQPRVDNNDTITGRVDYEYSRDAKIFGDYSFTRGNEVNVHNLPEFSTDQENRYHRLSATYNRTFGSNIVSTFNVNYNRRVETGFSKHAFQAGVLESLGIEGVSTPDPSDEGYPEINISGYQSLGHSHRNQSPRTSYSNNVELNANFTYVKRNHKFSFGLEAGENQLNDYRNGGLFRGKFEFDGYFTGNGFADFLLGIPAEATRGMGSDRADLRQRRYKAYLRDDWKISPRFSLSLGLTYNYNPLTRSVHDNVSLFWPLLFEPPVDGQVVTTGTPEAEAVGLAGLNPGQAAFTDKNDWAPSVGLAYSPTGNNKLVMRASYQWNYSPLDMRRTMSFIGRNAPYYWLEVASSPANPDLDLSSPFASSVSAETRIRAIDPYIRSEYTQEWQLTIQNEFIQSWNLEVRYVGRKSTGEARTVPGNVPPPLPEEAVIREYRPNPNFGQFDIGESSGSSIGHALELGLRKRLTSGFSLRSDFTWNRTFSDSLMGDPNNPRDLRAERALSQHFPPKRLSVNYIWDLPVGRDQAVSAEWAGKLRFLMEGWRISGITQFVSGRPFNPRLSGDWNNDGLRGDRPDRISSGVLPSSEQSIDRWFDTDAFVYPSTLGFGNSGRNILLLPGENTWDISLIKRTQVSDDGDTVEFRVQFFNAFNHANFERPNTTVGTDTFGIISNAKRAREIEIALKFTF